MNVISMTVAVIASFATGVATAQDYPNRPIRIVTTAAGGGGDFVARAVADGIAATLGQPVIIDNRTGFIPGVIVAKAPPDGYNLAVVGGSFWLAPLSRNTGYDTVKDFSYISMLVADISGLVVTASLPVKSAKELIALAKAKPGALNYASSSGGGGTAYLAGELFKSMAGVNIVWVPHKAAVEAFASLANADTHMMIADLGPVSPYLKSGKLRMLGVTSLHPSALAPGVPTVSDTGLPGYEVVNRTSIVAPANTPAPIITRLNRESVRVLHQPDVRTKMLSAAMEPIASSSEEMTIVTKAYITTWAKVIKDAGLLEQK